MPNTALSKARRASPEAIARYRRRRAIPYLLPVSWLEIADILTEAPQGLLLAEDETGNPRRKPIVLLPPGDGGGVPDVNGLIKRAAVEGPPGTRVVVMGTTKELRRLAWPYPWATDFDWWGMVREVHDPGPARRAVPLAEVPHLIPAACRLWNSAGFGDPIPQDKALAMARHHPLWLASNAYVVPEGADEIAAVVRLHLEREATGERFGFLRGLIVAPDVRQRSSFTVLSQLYAALMNRLLAEEVRLCYLKVATHSVSLQHLYRILGFRIEDRIQELSFPVRSHA